MTDTFPSPLVDLKQVSYALNKKTLLDNVDLTLYRGEIITLIGPNGAGKSTLVKLIVGLLQPSRGTLFRQSGIRIGYAPQRSSIDNTLPLSVKRFLTLAPLNRSFQEVLNEVGIDKVLLRTPIQDVSGGEWQRVLLARALLSQPDLLVLDEPAQGVDITGQNELYRLLTLIREKWHCGILLVSHDLHMVMASTTKVVCLQQHICCEGTPAMVQKDPAFIALFGEGVKELALYTHHHDHTHGPQGEVLSPSSSAVLPSKKETP